MNNDIKTGLSYELRGTVTDKNLASTLGSGTLPVFGTPFMIAMMEGAAAHAVLGLLDPGCSTVGIRLNIEHLAPSVLGTDIRAAAVLTAVDGRRLCYDVEAFGGDTCIGRGTHERFIVNNEKFMAKANK